MSLHPHHERKTAGPLQLLLIPGLIAVVILGVGVATRASRATQLQADAAEQGMRSVAVIRPGAAEAVAITTPGRIEAWSQAALHARVNGYLRSWSHDIGAPVKAGETLAVVDTPDADQALAQAKAELIRARSAEAFAAATARRWQALAASQAVSRQDADQRSADHAARQADASAAQANLQRLQALARYTHITAPFDGVVVARATDVGALVTTNATAGQPLFVVADVRRLRVYVNIPQRQVQQLRIGDTAQVQVPEWPGESFTAEVQSLSGAIDARTGAMRVQLVLDNAQGRLMPGSFATVRLQAAATPSPANALPPSALILGRKGVQIALVDAAGTVSLEPVKILRDHGTLVELEGALPADRQVINSPPDGLRNGEVVRVTQPVVAAR